MAGLLNLVPRYLPRYGMAPDWARAARPLVIVITAIGFIVTIAFKADVNAQGGAYATGVLVLMTSAAIAVTLAVPRGRKWFIPITVIFVYTTIVNMIERPEGLQIASLFIVAILGASLVSRVLRSTEVRIEGVAYDPMAARFITEAGERRSIRIIASRPNTGLPDEYARKLTQAKESHHLPDDAVLFLEISPGDASDFTGHLTVSGRRRRRLSNPSVEQPCGAQRDRRAPSRSSRPNRRDSARVLWVDRRQPHHVPAEVSRVRRG